MTSALQPRAPTAGTEADARLEILISDYEQCREDERSMVTTEVTLLSIGSTILGLLAAATTQTCQVRKQTGCVQVPDYLLAAAPLLPLTLFSFLYIVGTAATIRSYYMRGLEADLQTYAPEPMASYGGIRPASLHGLSTEITSFRRGRLPYRVMTGVTLFSLVFLFGGLAVYIAVHLSPLSAALMSVFYGTVFLILLAEVVHATLGGRGMFVTVAQRYLAHSGTILPTISAAPPPPAVGERNIWSYTALPRPGDLVKWLVLPGAWLVTAWPTARLHTWPRLLLLFLIFEYLLYEARYQWNDVRGLSDDQDHPERRARGRLPIGPGGSHAVRNITISLVSACVRLGAALAIGYRFGALAATAGLTVFLFATAGFYEALRGRPGKGDPLLPSLAALGLWLAVGIGYATRAGIGLAAAGLAPASGRGVVGIFGFAAFGIMFVLLTWVLEASSLCQLAADGQWYMLGHLRQKPHIASLLRFAAVHPEDISESAPGAVDASGDPGQDTYGGRHPILAGRSKLLAPWNVALTASLTLEGTFILSLVRPHAEAAAFAVMAMSGLVIGMLLALCSSSSTRIAVTLAGSIAQSSAALLAGATAPLWALAAVPCLAIAGLYTFFCMSTYSDITGFLPELAEQLRRLRAWALRALVTALATVVGRDTWSRYVSRSPHPLD